MRRSMMTFLLLAAASGCGGSDDVAGPGNVNLPQGSMSARIDGSDWKASAALTAAYSGQILAVAGTDGSFLTLGFAVAASAPGTYTIGPAQPTNALLTNGTTAASWVAVTTRGSGSITITSISATAATGTFTFNMIPDGNSGSTGNRSVTSGTFSVKY